MYFVRSVNRRQMRFVLVALQTAPQSINPIVERRPGGEQVLELGCNAVLAYQQDFDVEGDSGIVARAYGTACVIQQREQPPTSGDASKTKGNDHTLARQVLPLPKCAFCCCCGVGGLGLWRLYVHVEGVY